MAFSSLTAAGEFLGSLSTACQILAAPDWAGGKLPLVLLDRVFEVAHPVRMDAATINITSFFMSPPLCLAPGSFRSCCRSFPVRLVFVPGRPTLPEEDRTTARIIVEIFQCVNRDGKNFSGANCKSWENDCLATPHMGNRFIFSSCANRSTLPRSRFLINPQPCLGNTSPHH